MVREELGMKARELAVTVANISLIAASLGQMATTAQAVDGEKTITFTTDSIMSISDKLIGYCNQLGQLIPDIEIEVEGESDASHCNDE